MIIEGSGSGSIPLTSISGSGRPKNTWIRWIRIRNTGIRDPQHLISSAFELIILLLLCVQGDDLPPAVGPVPEGGEPAGHREILRLPHPPARGSGPRHTGGRSHPRLVPTTGFVDPDPGSGAFLTLDPDPGSGMFFFSGSRILDPGSQPHIF
jgi:hypothetical protein